MSSFCLQGLRRTLVLSTETRSCVVIFIGGFFFIEQEVTQTPIEDHHYFYLGCVFRWHVIRQALVKQSIAKHLNYKIPRSARITSCILT